MLLTCAMFDSFYEEVMAFGIFFFFNLSDLGMSVFLHL